LKILFTLLVALWGGAILLMSAANAHAAPQSEAWVTSPEGQTLLRVFRNAPFPYASREKGYTYDGKFYDAPTHYSDSTVGIFIPASYKPGAEVDYVVHFHGWSNHVAAVLDHYELRRQMAASGRNAILLVPQGPKDAQDSSGGRLEKEPGAFEALLREVTQFLVDAGKIHTTRIGSIALSTHSGGYLVTGAILRQTALRSHITDVLLFDSSYGELEAFADWAAEKHHRLVSIFTRHLAPENFMLTTLLQKRHTAFVSLLEPDLTPALLAARGPLFIHTLDLPHDEVMQKKDYFALFLRTSALPPTPAQAASK
jgi:hypothetical protein